MRLRTAVATATAALGAGTAAVVAVGRYGSRFALKPPEAGPVPEGMVTVHAVTKDRVVLTRTTASARRGRYGLAADGVHALVGDVADGTAYSVTRKLLAVPHGSLDAGSAVRLTPQVHYGNPRAALGLDYTEVDVPSELGPLPGWYLPGDRNSWVITVHGFGTTRAHAMNVLPALHHHGFTQLVLGYRGDEEAPPPPDGIGHLGRTEWRDLDAAMRYALQYGAERIVLYGWSTGATMALHAQHLSAVKNRVSGLVLDSPVLDWRATVAAAAESHGLPGTLAPLAVRAAEARTEPSGRRGAAPADPAPPTVPTLIFHGPEDSLAPWGRSRELAAHRPELVVLHTVRGAEHGAMWNVDPAGYEETLRRFLTPLM
ncbi:alpha/beta hydrolase [Streptomyces sp. NBC_01198]|uniref:alpha/beta hydrolase n=1 Tax=Streptomyces sp. NBC_01198 TaxID=2903769 RepID=UPI002E111F73|nr:alpha/beta fold hydrolase [Streptomyces sp. NBC_01198]